MDTEQICQLWYYPEENVFTDSDNNIIYDIYNIITPNQLFLFKKKQKYMFIEGINKYPVELFFLDLMLEDLDDVNQYFERG